MQNQNMPWHSDDPDEQPNRVPPDVAVSVCMITYNHAPYIRQSVDSVLMQRTNFKFEILIGEDDSTDGTREICRELAEQFPDRIRLFCRKAADKIIIAGRKTGRRNSQLTAAAGRGRYMALLEGDDFWIDADKLQRQFDFMEAHPEYQICGTRCLNWEPEEARVFPNHRQGNWLSYYNLARFGGGPHTSTFFMRTKAFRNMPAWTNAIIQRDLAILLTFAREGGGIPILPILTSVYREFGTGIWSGAQDRTDLVMQFWREFEAHAQASNDASGVKAARCNISYMQRWKKYGNKRAGRIWFHILSTVVYPSMVVRQSLEKLRIILS